MLESEAPCPCSRLTPNFAENRTPAEKPGQDIDGPGGHGPGGDIGQVEDLGDRAQRDAPEHQGRQREVPDEGVEAADGVGREQPELGGRETAADQGEERQGDVENVLQGFPFPDQGRAAVPVRGERRPESASGPRRHSMIMPPLTSMH